MEYGKSKKEDAGRAGAAGFPEHGSVYRRPIPEPLLDAGIGPSRGLEVKRIHLFHWYLLWLLIFVFGLAAFSRSASGSAGIEAYGLDPNGAAVAGAGTFLQNSETGTLRRATTDGVGGLSFYLSDHQPEKAVNLAQPAVAVSPQGRVIRVGSISHAIGEGIS